MRLSVSEKIHILIATGFYSGYSKFMPGTIGTLASIPVAVLLNNCLNKFWIAVFIILTSFYSFFICYDVERIFNKKDPHEIVLDEWLGFFISVFSIPVNFQNYLFAFIIFRIFDILKPFPIKNLEKLPHGIGVVADDLMAGFYTLIILKFFTN
jgi:phosphatidylglycerophosphatase A